MWYFSCSVTASNQAYRKKVPDFFQHFDDGGLMYLNYTDVLYPQKQEGSPAKHRTLNIVKTFCSAKPPMLNKCCFIDISFL